jgi:hypothetical protein
MMIPMGVLHILPEGSLKDLSLEPPLKSPGMMRRMLTTRRRKGKRKSLKIVMQTHKESICYEMNMIGMIGFLNSRIPPHLTISNHHLTLMTTQSDAFLERIQN